MFYPDMNEILMRLKNLIKKSAKIFDEILHNKISAWTPLFATKRGTPKYVPANLKNSKNLDYVLIFRLNLKDRLKNSIWVYENWNRIHTQIGIGNI